MTNNQLLLRFDNLPFFLEKHWCHLDKFSIYTYVEQGINTGTIMWPVEERCTRWGAMWSTMHAGTSIVWKRRDAMRGLILSCAEMPEVVAVYNDALGMDTLYTESGEAGVELRWEVITWRSEGVNMMPMFCGWGSLKESWAEGPVTHNDGPLPGKMIERLQPSKHRAFCSAESPWAKKNAECKIKRWSWHQADAMTWFIKARLVIGPRSQWAQVICYGERVWKVRCHLNGMSKFAILALQYAKWIQSECLAHLVAPLDTEDHHKFKDGKGHCSLQESVTQAIAGQLLRNVNTTPVDTILFEIYVSDQGEYIRNLHCSHHRSSVRWEVSHLEWGGPHAPEHLQCRSPQDHSNARSAKSYPSISLIDAET